tara:strand:+ start:880 stop:1185 length:306 start_codon:yes stop_codon:yes gene_type:complete
VLFCCELLALLFGGVLGRSLDGVKADSCSEYGLTVCLLVGAGDSGIGVEPVILSTISSIVTGKVLSLLEGIEKDMDGELAVYSKSLLTLLLLSLIANDIES